MKDKLFFDSDIILDIAVNRKPFYAASSLLMSRVELKQFYGFTSSIIISNIYYILRKIESHKTAIDYISKLRLIINILAVDDDIIKAALESKFKDFEDAIQYYTALKHKMDHLITRNIKHYIRSEITAHTPEEFLKLNEIKNRVGKD